MENRFEEIVKDIYLLKVPFAGAFTGVILVNYGERMLFDTAASGDDVDNYILPALAELGLTLKDIKYLSNTHSHGDHIGGYQRVKQLNPEMVVVAANSDYQNVENPAALAIRIRGKYPEYSPAPQSYLKGVKVDKVLADGEYLNDRMAVIETPGHDLGCVCWYDSFTKTIITGDSIQGNGTPTQGVGFYQDLDAYRNSMNKLLDKDVENIICGHYYDMIGDIIVGKKAVENALHLSLNLTYIYQKYIDNKLNNGMENDGQIATAMINDIGCGMPDKLFMAVYTVNQHKLKH